MSSINDFTSAFQNSWEEAQSEVHFRKAELSRILDVHPSQIPYCPTAFILGFRPDLENSYKMTGKCILDSGTAIHAAVQDFLGRSKHAFGDYVCPECGEFFQGTCYHDCPNDGHPLNYREVSINYKGFVGHVDFLYKLDNGDLWLIDFKTSAMSAIAKKVVSTPENYNLQTLSYALLLRLQYGWKVKGRAICYINRDNPAYMKLGGVELITKEHLKYIHGVLKSQRGLLHALCRCHSLDEFLAMTGGTIPKCKNPFCKICRSPYSDEEIKQMLTSVFNLMQGKCILDFVKEAEDRKKSFDTMLNKFANLVKGESNEG